MQCKRHQVRKGAQPVCALELMRSANTDDGVGAGAGLCMSTEYRVLVETSAKTAAETLPPIVHARRSKRANGPELEALKAERAAKCGTLSKIERKRLNRAIARAGRSAYTKEIDKLVAEIRC